MILCVLIYHGHLRVAFSDVDGLSNVYVQPGNTKAQLGVPGQLLEATACFPLFQLEGSEGGSHATGTSGEHVWRAKGPARPRVAAAE